MEGTNDLFFCGLGGGCAGQGVTRSNMSSLGKCVCVRAQSCLTLCDPMARLFCPWDFPGKNTGVGCHFLLQGIFPIQGSNLRLLHWQVDSFITEPPEKPCSPFWVEFISQNDVIAQS